jgi:adenylosuccinate synthase
LRRSIQLNSFSGLCVTKLDVLDGLETVRICVGYRLHGRDIAEMPTDAIDLAACEPIYEDLPGWTSSTVGVKVFSQLPREAQHYLQRVEKLAGVPIDIISTGPDRCETIIVRHPLGERETCV